MPIHDTRLSARRMRAVAGPEIARVITEFDVGMLARMNVVFKHHVQSPSVQQRFVAHTKALVIAFQEAGNPFDEDSHEVVIIDTREVRPNNVARSIMGALVEGKKQHAILWRIACSLQQSHSTRQSR